LRKGGTDERDASIKFLLVFEQKLYVCRLPGADVLWWEDQAVTRKPADYQVARISWWAK